MKKSKHSIRTIDWRTAYVEVLRETDSSKLFKLVEVAESAILTRRDALVGSTDHHAEKEAIEQAVRTLKLVKRDRLKFD